MSFLVFPPADVLEAEGVQAAAVDLSDIYVCAFIYIASGDVVVVVPTSSFVLIQASLKTSFT